MDLFYRMEWPCHSVIFNLCKKHHNRIIIGTDAHEPGALSDTKTYNRAYTYLKESGLEITEDIKMLR